MLFGPPSRSAGKFATCYGRRIWDIVARPIGAIIAIALLVAGCGAEAPSDAAAPDLRAGRLATLADLVGPWQPVPFRIDANVRVAAERACRADQDFPPGVQLVGIDARGGGRLITIFAGPDGATAECAYTQIARNGAVTGSLSATGGSAPVAPLAPGHLEPGVGGGGFSDDSGAAVQYVVGRVGAGTERVVLDVEGIGPVGASLSNGSYIAWWAAGLSPANAPGRRHMQGKAFTVTAYDAAGQTTDRIGSAN